LKMTRTERAGIVRQGLNDAAKEEALGSEAIEHFTATGVLMINEAFPGDSFSIIQTACRRLSAGGPLSYTRRIKDPKWHNVRTVTLFRFPRPVVETPYSSMPFRAPELVEAAVKTDSLIRLISGRLQASDHPKGYNAARTLFGHTSTRAVINKMLGTPDDPAVIGLHPDVAAEHGANASLTLDEGEDLVTGETVPPNRLTIYGCHDLCRELDIAQSRHGFSATALRQSVVFTRFQ
jgi:hypothetical protein